MQPAYQVLYLSSQKMNDFKRMPNNPHCHLLLAIVTTVHHQTVRQSLNDRTKCLAESFGLVTTSRVRQILGMFVLYCNVILTEEFC